MKADPALQLRLLDLQILDARVDQLRHQRAHLPELAELATLQASRDQVDGQRRDQQIVVDDLRVEQLKAERDVETVRTRRTRDRDRMGQGLMTNPKDLERMGHELESLERRIGVLEDEELEVMMQLEEAQGGLEELVQKLAGHDERLAELYAASGAKTGVIDADLTAAVTEREPAAAGLPEDLMALYEKLRTTKNGVAVAELRARQCTGCRLTLDHAEIGRIRTTDENQVIRCEECQRILIRTPESGL